MVIIVISGTGGTGKTAAAKALVKFLDDYKLVELNKLAKRTKAYKAYDATRKTNIVDIRKLKAEVKKLTKKHKNLILEGLFAHEFDADIVIILRCRPDVLRKRLKKKYSWYTKIDENVEAEMLGVITEEAVAKHGWRKVFEIDTSKKTAKKTAKAIKGMIGKKQGKKQNRYKNQHKVGKINWLSAKLVKTVSRKR